MFLRQYPRRQDVGVVRGQHRHSCLHDQRAAVEGSGDEVHAGTVLAGAAGDGALVCGQARKRRQQ